MLVAAPPSVPAVFSLSAEFIGSCACVSDLSKLAAALALAASIGPHWAVLQSAHGLALLCSRGHSLAWISTERN
jgi:hypothetical protein